MALSPKFPNLDDCQRIVFDVETTGLDWKRHRPVGYVVTWGPGPHETRYFPTDHEGGGNCDKNTVLAWLNRLLRRPDLQVVGHHLKFDLHFAANDGLHVVGPVIDTMVNAALIDENIGAYSLDAVSRRHNVQVKKGDALYAEMARRFGGKPDRSQMANFYKMPGDHPLVTEYAEGDGTSTWQVCVAQEPILDHENLRPVWVVECGVLPVLFRMERRGVRVDEARLHWLKQYLTEKTQEAERVLPPGFNPRSAESIKKYLVDRGITAFPRTTPTTRFPQGQDSFVSAWLDNIPEGVPIMALRRLSGMMSKFVTPMLNDHLFNGRVHCEYNQLRQDEYGTVTGRLSSSNPNMQQIPKRNKTLAPLFRQIFLPDEGHQWSANDYSQQEFRVFGDYTGNFFCVVTKKSTSTPCSGGQLLKLTGKLPRP
jgi:DNA polymerase I-like protein with 3'-5' exonuclease and polymerase domains